MPRWDPQAEDRLREAALELFLERGYENVTVTEITERAGLTRRSFSRYFRDKRDVLFADDDRLPGAFADAIRRADRALPPFAALLAALADVADGLLADQAPLAAQRRAVTEASPELQERGRTKFAAAGDATAKALRERGVGEPQAELLAQVGVAIFRTAFTRWTDQPGEGDLPSRIREAAAELAASVAAPPETPAIACLCGSTRFYDQFQQANYDLTMRGEIVLSVGFYPHATTQPGHGEGAGHAPAEKAALDELHKRKIDLADYVLVVSDESGYFGESTKGEIRYAVEHGKPVRFTEPQAALRAQALGLAAAGEPAAP